MDAPENPSLQTGEVIKSGQETPRVQAVVFSGPLPPPAVFAEYERACPGAADRILSMAEKEQQHRHGQENTLSTDVSAAMRRGQVFACAIAITGPVVAAFVAIFGNGFAANVLAALIGVGGFAPIVTAFLKTNRKDDDTDV